MRGSDFAELRAFVEVANFSSFARAAERLRLSPSTLSQTIRALEERLGVTLFNRTTRRVSLTGAGSRLLERFAPAMAEMEAAVRDARDQEHRPRGLVRLHSPRAAYDSHIAPMLGGLASNLPDVVLDLAIDDGFGDFAADGFDLFVRHAADVDSSMVAAPLGGELRHVVVASPGYLSANGTPQLPGDLLDHRCVAWRRPGTIERYRWRFLVDGEFTTLAVAGSLVASHCDVVIAAAQAGVGIAYVLEPLAAKGMKAGNLVSLLENYLPPFEGWRLCRPRERRAPAAVLAIVAALSATE